MNKSTKTRTTAKKRWILFFITLGICFNYVTYKELPDDFPQAWKYRLLSFGSDLLSYVGKVLQYFEIAHRIHLTRLAYHVTVGLVNIRDPLDGIQVRDELVNNVLIRVYSHLNYSNDNKQIPTIFMYHGGGYFLGSADIYDSVNYLLAKQTKMMVIYVEFRLIPEHPFPAALNDSLLTTLSILRDSNKYNIDLNAITLVGDSAGGNLATVICRKLIELKVARPKLNVLIYPILQFFDFTLPSYVENMPKRILGEIDEQNFVNFIKFFTNSSVDKSILLNGHTSSDDKQDVYLKYIDRDLIPSEYHRMYQHTLNRKHQLNSTLDEKVRNILLSSDVSPLLVDDKTLAQTSAENTFILTVGLDILLDDSLILLERLKRVGARVHHEHYENLFHGILGLLHGPLEFKAAQRLLHSVSNHILKTIHFL